MRWVRIDSLKQKKEGVLCCHPEHDICGEQATRTEGLHCFLQINERRSVNLWHLPTDGLFIGSYVMKEVGVPTSSCTLSALS